MKHLDKGEKTHHTNLESISPFSQFIGKPGAEIRNLPVNPSWWSTPPCRGIIESFSPHTLLWSRCSLEKVEAEHRASRALQELNSLCLETLWNERWKLVFQDTRKWSLGARQLQAGQVSGDKNFSSFLSSLFKAGKASSGKAWLSPRVCWALPAQHLLTVRRAKGNSKVQELLDSEQDEGHFHAFPSRLFLTLEEFEGSAIAVPSPSSFWAELFEITPQFPLQSHQ